MSTTTTTADKIVRRRVAVEFLGKGMTAAGVALVLGVGLSSMKRWKKAHRQGGEQSLLPNPQLGAEPKLDASQRERLRQLLVAGPLAAGFSTELWTCRGMAKVVRCEFGVDYHPDHLGRILHAKGSYVAGLVKGAWRTMFPDSYPLRSLHTRDEHDSALPGRPTLPIIGRKCMLKGMLAKRPGPTGLEAVCCPGR